MPCCRSLLAGRLLFVKAIVAIAMAFPWQAHGQGQSGPIIAPGIDSLPTNSYPNDSYYLALAQYREGEMANAAVSFEMALGRCRKDPQGRWLDSIPVLAMMAESLYQSGDLAGAIENIDAALSIALRQRGWLKAINWTELASGAVRQPDPAASWAGPQVPTVLPIPDRLSLASGSVDLTQTFQRGGVAESAKLIRIDAVEVMRGIALALYRRGVILGEISGEFPEGEQALQAILYPPNFNVPIGKAIIGSMRGCGKFAAGKVDELASDIGNYAAFAGGVHPLTPVVLLAGARQAATTNQPTIAIALATRAATAASALGQSEFVGEAMLIAAGCVDPASAKPLQLSASAAAISHQRRGGLASLGAMAAAADAALTAGDPAAATAMLTQLRRLITQRDFQQPRLAAHADYLQAVAAAQAGASLGDGSGAVDEPLLRSIAFAGSGGSLMQWGTARRGRNSGPSTPRLFQLGFVTADARFKGLNGRAVEARIAGYVNDPPIGVWRNDPVDAIAFASFDRNAIAQDQFAAAIKRGAPESILIQGDALLRQRFVSALPLGGRVQQVRSAVSTSRSLLSPETVAWLDQGPVALRAMGDILALPPAPEGSPEAIGRGRQLESLATQIALSRGEIPSSAPHPLADSQGLTNLSPESGLLSFIDIGGAIVCILAAGQKVEVWPAPASRVLAADVAKLLRGIGLGQRRGGGGEPASDAWEDSALTLRQRLIPDDKLPLFEPLRQLSIVPDGPLWYLPMELLPMGAGDDAKLGQKFSITYAPTPGFALFPAAMPRPDLGIGSSAGPFFVPRDRDLNQQLYTQITEGLPNHVTLPRQGVPSSNRLGESLGFFAALGVITPDVNAPLATGVSLFDANPTSGSLGAWLRLSSRTPPAMFLPGYRTAAIAPALGTGRELFMTLTALHVAGVRDVVISRWPVGGSSTAILTRELLQEVPLQGVAPAWRQALQTLRAGTLDPQSEPLMAGSAVKEEVSGDLPLFWAGYLLASPPDVKSTPGAQPNGAVLANGGAPNLQAPPGVAMPPQAAAGAANPVAAAKIPAAEDNEKDTPEVNADAQSQTDPKRESEDGEPDTPKADSPTEGDASEQEPTGDQGSDATDPSDR